MKAKIKATGEIHDVCEIGLYSDGDGIDYFEENEVEIIPTQMDFVKKEDLETIVREVVENTWYGRRSINPIEEQTEEITNGIYNKLMGINVEKQTCKCDNRHIVYSLKTDKSHCINCHKDIAEEEKQ